MEDRFDQKVCTAQHQAVDIKLKIIMSSVVLILGVCTTGSAFMVAASRNASATKALLDIQNVENLKDHAALVLEDGRLTRETDVARAEASKDLASALRIVGYDQRESQTTMIRMAEANSRKLEALGQNMEIMAKDIRQIQQIQQGVK